MPFATIEAKREYQRKWTAAEQIELSKQIAVLKAENAEYKRQYDQLYSEYGTLFQLFNKLDVSCRDACAEADRWGNRVKFLEEKLSTIRNIVG